MNIHLIKTAEYSIDKFTEIYELLCSSDGPIKFITHNCDSDTDDMPLLNMGDKNSVSNFEKVTKKILHTSNESHPASWQELFSICNYYRNYLKVDSNDIVVLLTSHRNELNWFSIFDNEKNAFVHTGDWEHFIQSPHKFPVAYEVVANILRISMNLSWETENPCVHRSPIGCVNDLCQNKKEIILKLRTGDICGECLKQMESEGVGEDIINHVLEIFETIRNQMLFRMGFTRNIHPRAVKVTDTGAIIIGEKKIELTPIRKALYIFYLKHREGIRLVNLQDFKEELRKIYLTIRPGGEENKIERLISLIDGTFSTNKTRINKEIKKQLGEPLANFYYLTGNPGEAFRINLPENCISIDTKY